MTADTVRRALELGGVSYDGALCIPAKTTTEFLEYAASRDVVILGADCLYFYPGGRTEPSMELSATSREFATVREFISNIRRMSESAEQRALEKSAQAYFEIVFADDVPLDAYGIPGRL